MRTVAALYVDEKGPYVGEPGVEIWGISRDARLYAGPHPVVAHPPCSSWCQLAPLNQARYGHPIGADEGCFAAALAAVRRWGGVLEHPAKSYAWSAFGLERPPARGGWIRDIFRWVDMSRRAGPLRAPAAKATWLYACHVALLPSLQWGKAHGKALVSWCNNHRTATDDRPRVGKRKATETPEMFKAMLLQMARNVPQVAPLAEGSDP